jgi:hypothetical protein
LKKRRHIIDNKNIDYSRYLDLDDAFQTCVDLTDEEISNFCMKKTSVEIEEELKELIIEN